MTNASPFGAQVVRHTREVTRIAALPRRVWTDDAATELAKILTREFRRPGGTMQLRPIQAVALYEAMQVGGLFGPIAVGGGKTLLTLLLPRVLDAKRPVLLLPAALIEKTWHERKELEGHWYLPTNQQLISYELLSLVQSATRLEYIKPDYIGADEAHMLKGHKAGRTRRVTRYMREHPETKFVAVSGTIMKASIRDFAHLLRWSLKDNAPIPLTDDESDVWADALDEKVNPLARANPDALFDIAPRPEGLNKVTAARRVFQARLLETCGVVASSNTDGCDASLRVTALEYTPSPATELHIANMKGLNDDPVKGISLAWTTPDGWTFSEAIELWRYIRELALGFHGIWDPRPPPDWVLARRNWASFVREVLSASRSLDTELQVTNAVDAGTLSELRSIGTQLLSDWRAVRDTYKIQTRPVWHDDTALKVAAEWAEREKGIVWIKHVHFGERLSHMTGLPYYGPMGRTPSGESIVNVKPGRAILASVDANKAGRNLQMFSKNLVTSISSNALENEQLIGRTHREGQTEDEVTVDMLLGCKEHHESFYRAIDVARAVQDTMGHTQKLLIADKVFPDISNRKGPLWT